MKLGFIGFGRIAQAVCEGFIRSKALKKEDIYAYAPHKERLLENCHNFGISPSESLSSLVDECQILILATPIDKASSILIEMKPLKSFYDKKIISFVAGKEIDDLLLELKSSNDVRSMKVIPNIPVAVGEGIFICDKDNNLEKEDKQEIYSLLYKVGKTILVSKKEFSVCGTLAGCGPALLCVFAQGLEEAGEKLGINPSLSKEMVSKMILGTGSYLLEKGGYPRDLIEKVCTPNGTTIKGVKLLNESKVKDLAYESVMKIEGMEQNPKKK